MWGFPEPHKLGIVSGTYDDVQMPSLWQEATAYLLEHESGDFQIAFGDLALMHTPDVLPPRDFKGEIPYLKIWDITHWEGKTVPDTKVFCPVSYQVYDKERTKQKAFTQRCGMCVNAEKLLDMMEHVYPEVARQVESTLDAIRDPKFYMMVKYGKNNKRKTMESDPQTEAKEGLIKKVITSAYYRILFKRHDLEEYPADELAIMRAMCPLLEEDEANTHSL